MHDVDFVKILNTIDKLQEKPLGFLFADSFVFSNIFEQVPFFSVFHDYKNFVLALYDFKNSNNVRMADFEQYADLYLDPL